MAWRVAAAVVDKVAETPQPRALGVPVLWRRLHRTERCRAYADYEFRRAFRNCRICATMVA